MLHNTRTKTKQHSVIFTLLELSYRAYELTFLMSFQALSFLRRSTASLVFL